MNTSETEDTPPYEMKATPGPSTRSRAPLDDRQPYEDSSPPPMLSVVTKSEWINLSYLALQPVYKKGRSVVAVFGDFELRIMISQGVNWSIDEMRKHFQEHRINTIRNDPEKGLSLSVVQIVRGEDGPEELPIF